MNVPTLHVIRQQDSVSVFRHHRHNASKGTILRAIAPIDGSVLFRGLVLLDHSAVTR